MRVRKGVKELVAAAEARVASLSPAEVADRLERPGALLVDLRDIRELRRDGVIPGAMHVPRGMLEFWVDPDSPYYRKRFDGAEFLILFCNKGARSALAAATLADMGVDGVAHMAGGLERWRRETGRVEPAPEKPRPAP